MTSDIVEVHLSAGLLAAAEKKVQDLGTEVLNANSMRGLAALQVGAVGELAFMSYLDSLHIRYEDDSALSMNHDIRVFLDLELKLDVKSKERKPLRPSADWDCTVSDYLLNYQDVDYYAFVSVASSNTKSDSIDRFEGQVAYILGTAHKSDFLEKAEFIKKGTYDWTNGFTSHKDQWNMKVKDLRAPKGEKVVYS